MSQRTVDGGERYPCAVGFRGNVWGSAKEDAEESKNMKKTAEKSEKQVSPLFFWKSNHLVDFKDQLECSAGIGDVGFNGFAQSFQGLHPELPDALPHIRSHDNGAG